MINPERADKVSILLVEDDDVDAMGVERALKKQKCPNPFYRARNGLEGLELLREKRVTLPFLVIMDLNMPVMSGLETLKEIREDPNLTKCVVFVLTTSDAPEDVSTAYKHHIAGYIVKSSLINGFTDLFQLLKRYWQLIEFPTNGVEH